jgi:hypothetical protein
MIAFSALLRSWVTFLSHVFSGFSREMSGDYPVFLRSTAGGETFPILMGLDFQGTG